MASGSGSTVARLRIEFLGDLSSYRASLKTAKVEGDAATKTMGQSFKANIGRTWGDIIKSAVAPKTIAAPLGKEWVASQLQAWTKANPTAVMDAVLAKQKSLTQAAAAHTVALTGSQRAMMTLGNLTGLVTGKARSVGTAFTGVGGSIKSALSNAAASAFHSTLGKISSTAKGFVSTLKSIPANIFKGIGMGLGIGIFQNISMEVSKLIHLIPELISKGKDYGQRVADIMHATGATGEAASRVAATINFLNKGPVNNLTQLLAQLARNVGGAGVAITKSEKDLKQFGISIRDTGGNVLNGVDLLERLRSGLSKVADGTEKLALVQQMVGRGGAKVFIDFLRLTDAQYSKLVNDFQAQGLIITSAQATLAENTNRELNRMGNAWAGLGNRLFNTVGPVINAFITNVTNWLTSHAQDVANAVSTVVSSILGLVSGLTGMTGLGSFTESLGGQGDQLSNAATAYYEADNALATYDASQKKAVVSTAGNTKAIDAQIKALDTLDKAQEKTYQTRLKAIKAILDEKTATLDAAEAARSLALQQHDLNEQLNLAQIDLQKALAGEPGKGVNAEDVSKAMANIADIQNQQGELAHQTAVDQQRAAIKSVQDYLSAIDQMVQDSTDKTATLKSLKAKEGALTTGGKPAAGSDAALELQAVLAAEQRVRQQGVNDAKQARLQEQRDAISGAGSTAGAITDLKRAALAKQLADAKRVYDDEINLEKRLGTTKLHNIELIDADTQKTFGTEGTATQAFRDWEAAGVSAIGNIKGLFDDLGGVIKGLVGPDGALSKFASLLSSTADDIKNVVALANGQFKLPTIRDILGPHLGDLFGYTEEYPNGKNYIEGRAAGGPITPGTTYRINEGSPYEGLFSPKLPGVVVPAPAMPAFAAMGARGVSGSPAIIRIEIGGKPLTDYVDEHLSWRRSV